MGLVRSTKKELSDSLENLGIRISDPDMIQMIEKIDVNGDGCVDMDEFGELYRSIMGDKDEDEDMKEAFNVLDQSGRRIEHGLGSLGLKHGKALDECKRMIKKVDADGDGMVNSIVFKRMMKAGGSEAASVS